MDGSILPSKPTPADLAGKAQVMRRTLGVSAQMSSLSGGVPAGCSTKGKSRAKRHCQHAGVQVPCVRDPGVAQGVAVGYPLRDAASHGSV